VENDGSLHDAREEENFGRRTLRKSFLVQVMRRMVITMWEDWKNDVVSSS
jgi:hypothetical protein